MHDFKGISDEAGQIATMEFLCEKYGWLPSEIDNQPNEVIEYFVAINNFKTQRQKREQHKH